MKVLFIVLNNVDYLEDVLSILVEHDVNGATVLESQGMGSTIVNNNISDIPLFGSLKSLLKDSNPYNKTIFTVIKDQEKLYKVVEAIKYFLNEEKKVDAGIMFTVPVDEIFC
jgi:nitrogen regulatory protein P-II 1